MLALHGFNDYSNAFQATGHYFAAHGIATYAYDQRGFGASVRPGIWPTDETMIADLHTVASLVRGRHPGVPFYLLGESMGGAVVMSALASPTPAGFEPLAPTGAILSAPAVWDRDSLTALQRAALWISYRTVPWLRLTAPRDEILKEHHPAASEKAPSDIVRARDAHRQDDVEQMQAGKPDIVAPHHVAQHAAVLTHLQREHGAPGDLKGQALNRREQINWPSPRRSQVGHRLFGWAEHVRGKQAHGLWREGRGKGTALMSPVRPLAHEEPRPNQGARNAQ